MSNYSRTLFSIQKKIYHMTFPSSLTRPVTRVLMGKKNLVGAEIGVQFGYNARNILDNLDIKKLYLIDPFMACIPGRENRSIIDGRLYPISTSLEKSKQIIKNSDKVEFIVKFSEDAVKDIDDDLDFVYIDGDHRYEFVKKDIELYYPKLKADGLMGGHDFYSRYIGLIRAVLEFANKKDLEVRADPMDVDWWYEQKVVKNERSRQNIRRNE